MHSQRYETTPQSDHGRRSAILIVLAAALGVVTLVSTLLLLRPAAQTPSTETVTETEGSTTSQASREGQGQSPAAPDQQGQAAGEESAPVESGGVRAGGPGDESAPVDEAALAAWAEDALEFMHVYPANYILKADGGNEPLAMEPADWAQTCLDYVYPDSDLASQLENDPESLISQLGSSEAGRFVVDAEVTSTSELGINVTVTIDDPQSNSDHANALTEEYLVQFNPNGKITNVERVQ
ncbi:MAG: hypothetical protein J6D34_09170 [Atopobiaceae bacterium]|nr:hypothetical protein [Atopobiaceae bacterium]